MGWLSKAKKSIQRGITSTLGNRVGGAINSAIDTGTSLKGFSDPLRGDPVYNLVNPKKPPAPPPGEDPQVTALRQKMYDEANRYRADMPGLMAEQDILLKKDATNALDTGTRDTRRNFNDRGLLYSGMRQGAESDLKSRVATQLAQSQADSKRGFEDTARAKENVAAQVGLSGYQAALQRAEDVYNMQLSKNIQQRQMMQQLGQAGGYAAGTAYGGGFQRPTPLTPQTYVQPTAYYMPANNYSYNPGLMPA